MEKHILHKLKIPKDCMITTIEDTDLRNRYDNDTYRRPKFKWKYIPGFDEHDVDCNGSGQLDWECNPCILSKDLGLLLLYGFIRTLNEQNQRWIAETAESCIKYWYIHIQRCFSWILDGYQMVKIMNTKYQLILIMILEL